jgi:ADP-heptose:LPS heptosyltransferase
MAVAADPAGAWLTPPSPRFESVHRIAVLRGGGLGDLMFAMPAIRALAAAYPGAHVTLLGAPMHAELLRGRSGAPHDAAVVPATTGVREGTGEDPAETERFLERMRRRRFDLAVQVHGGGAFSNPFLLALGARHTVGTRSPDAAELERTLPYVYYQHEVLRALEVVGLAGAAPVGLEPVVAVSAAEYEAAVRHLDPAAEGVVVLHPGATDPRRRWPADRFAEVAARVADDGYQVIVVGDAGERALAEGILERARERASEPARPLLRSLAGELTLSQLTGLLASADVVLANDSGPRHLAQAVGTRTVSVFWIGNVINGAPLGRGRHRVHMSWTSRCPVCGADCTLVDAATRCEHDVSFVADVDVGPVYDDVRALLLAGSAEDDSRAVAEGAT